MTPQQIPIDRLDPNPWNANRMTDDEFAELVAEVEHLGRIAKPVIVRPQGDRFQIIDGEHNYRAAKQCGHTEVPCEVIDADDFESMRQTYKRNQHGQHSPVLEGMMFRDMKSASDLSTRELAKQINVSEGTIRNGLRFAEAADKRREFFDRNPEWFAEVTETEVRNSYAPGDDPFFDGLTVRQLRDIPTNLPAEIWDGWKKAECPDFGTSWFGALFRFVREWDLWRCVNSNKISPGGLRSFEQRIGLGFWKSVEPEYQRLAAALLSHESIEPTDAVDMLRETKWEQDKDDEDKWTPFVPVNEYLEVIEKLCKTERFPASAFRDWHKLQKELQHDTQSPMDVAIRRKIKAEDYPDELLETDMSFGCLEYLVDEYDEWRERDWERRDWVIGRVVEKYNANRQLAEENPNGRYMLDARRLINSVRDELMSNAFAEMSSSVEEPEHMADQIIKLLSEYNEIANGTFDGKPAAEFVKQRLLSLPQPELLLIKKLVHFRDGSDLQVEAVRAWFSALCQQHTHAMPETQEHAA